MFVNITRSLKTKKSLSFALESVINVGDIYTFDSVFVPLEKANDIFIDTVKIKYENAFVNLGKGTAWKYDKEKYQHYVNIPVNGTNIKLTFKKDPDDSICMQTVKGTVYVEMSVPIVLYGTNVCGIKSTAVNALYEKLTSLLTDADVEFSFDGSHLNFENYKVTRIDRSFCFNAGSEEAKEEYLRIFRKLRIPYHDPGRCKDFDDYDYETGFSHGSDSSDFILYDKNEELREHKRVEIEDDNEMKINVLRLEIRCRKPKGKKSSDNESLNEKPPDKNIFGLFGKVIRSNNQTLLDILKQYRLDLKILPEQEFLKTIKDFLAKERNLHSDKKARRRPKYLQYTDEAILDFFQYINDYDEVTAYDKNDTMFNVCKTITSLLGVMNIYTIHDKSLSFIDDVLSHAETTKTDKKPYKGISIAYLMFMIGTTQKSESVYLLVVDFFNLILNKQPVPHKRE